MEIPDEVTDVKCEKCGRNMVIKTGRFGRFLACPGFPECRNAKPIQEEAGVSCPLCGGRVLIKKAKTNRKYLRCENHPQCGFISWDMPSRELPEMRQFMAKKYRARRSRCYAAMRIAGSGRTLKRKNQGMRARLTTTASNTAMNTKMPKLSSRMSKRAIRKCT